MLYGALGLAAVALRPGVVEQERPSSLVLNDAFVYLAAQVESGLFCPLSMTRALARTLLKFAPHEIIADYVPRLTATDPARLYTGAMFMTEKHGGSDLGATATSARPADDRPGWWVLSREKSFCIQVNADLILTPAPPQTPPAG